MLAGRPRSGHVAQDTAPRPGRGAARDQLQDRQASLVAAEHGAAEQAREEHVGDRHQRLGGDGEHLHPAAPGRVGDVLSLLAVVVGVGHQMASIQKDTEDGMATAVAV